jgi:hypothetical protein
VCSEIEAWGLLLCTRKEYEVVVSNAATSCTLRWSMQCVGKGPKSGVLVGVVTFHIHTTSPSPSTTTKPEKTG